MERAPAKVIEDLVRSWEREPDDVILDALRALPPLADEDDPCWTTDHYWNTVAYPYLALADVAAARRLRPAIALLLDRACFGDPGEIMRGLRHALEAIVNPDWDALTEACLLAAHSARPGTRLWALDELAVLDDPRAQPLFEAALLDPSSHVRTLAKIGLERLAREGEA